MDRIFFDNKKKKLLAAMTFQTKNFYILYLNVDLNKTEFIPFPLHFHIWSFQLRPNQPTAHRRLLHRRFRVLSLHPHFQHHHFHCICYPVDLHLIRRSLNYHYQLLHLPLLVVCVLQLPVVLQALKV